MIRAATAADLPALLDLYAHMHPNDPRPSLAEAQSALARLQTMPGSDVFLKCDGAQILASVTLAVVPNLTRVARSYGVIENVVTWVNARRQGHATDLLRHACDVSWAQGCYKVMLMTGSTRPETLRFYRAAGFEQSKTGFQIRRDALSEPAR